MIDTFEFLKQFRKVAVVGISANPSRPSHWIAKYLQEHGFEVTGVNPGLPKVEGIRVVASLKDVGQPLEIVNVFRSPSSIPALVEEALPLHPSVFWLQPGAENPEAEEFARKSGLTVVSGNCIYRDHQKMA